MIVKRNHPRTAVVFQTLQSCLISDLRQANGEVVYVAMKLAVFAATKAHAGLLLVAWILASTLSAWRVRVWPSSRARCCPKSDSLVLSTCILSSCVFFFYELHAALASERETKHKIRNCPLGHGATVRATTCRMTLA